MNILAILLGYLAVLVFGATSLVAIGLLIAGRTKAARILFAGGLLGGAGIMEAAVLWLFSPEFQRDVSTAAVGVIALSVFLAAAGQFVASLRSPGRYGLAFACTACAIMLAASPLVAGDWSVRILGDFGLTPPQRGQPFLAALSLLPAVASVVIAMFFPFGIGPIESENHETRPAV